MNNTPTLKQDLEVLLTTYSHMLARQEAYKQTEQALMDAVLTDEQRQEIATIRLEFADVYDTMDERIAEVRTEIERIGKLIGESVVAAGFRAEYHKASVKWNTDKLEGFAVLYPDVLSFRTVGQPSVQIKAVRK